VIHTDKTAAALRALGYDSDTAQMELQFYKDNGATSNGRTDAENEFLTAQGYTTGSVTDKWYALLSDQGYTGSLTDMVNASDGVFGLFGGGGGATFPVIESFAHTAALSGLTINMPSGIVPGDLLVCLFRSANTPTGSFTSGWTRVVLSTASGGWQLFWKVAQGSDSLSVGITFNTSGTATCFRISSANNIQVAGGYIVGQTITMPSITPSGGEQNYLFLSAIARNMVAFPTSASANYTDQIQSNTAGGGAQCIWTVRRELRTTTEQPGSWTLSQSADAFTATVAIWNAS
jgi:hypothetical protein